MIRELPRPATTQELYLAAVLAELRGISELLAKNAQDSAEPVANLTEPAQPKPRKRAPRKTTAKNAKQ
jgi:hypothetical protein